ncbi:hypothetical protein [Shewanella sp. FJAT-52076]|nr:hypothetical protein [Shewanella sp. FJAT-52076]QYJ75092.1 hypothetical protein K0H79_17395 [Shewanella sp. FJAT-52076]
MARGYDQTAAPVEVEVGADARGFRAKAPGVAVIKACVTPLFVERNQKK